jgi:hypothetical protein
MAQLITLMVTMMRVKETIFFFLAQQLTTPQLNVTTMKKTIKTMMTMLG